MTSIWTIRLFVSKLLFNIFGYLLPCLDSTKAIVSKDDEGIREYLTYWSVFGLFLYAEFLLNYFSVLRNWPPESKVLFILWLTLPQFQGAFRIYTYILKPNFEKYEQDIDEQINIISQKVRQKAHRHLKTILWQLFLAPNDGLLAGAISLSTSLAKLNVINSFLSRQDSDPFLSKSLSQEFIEPQKRLETTSLRMQLLRNFTGMLIEGIYADVKCCNGTNTLHSSSTSSELKVCKVNLMKGGFHLQITEQQASDDVCGNSNDISVDLVSREKDSLIIPLLSVGSVTSDNIDTNMVTIQICDTSPMNAEQMKTVYLCVENEEEAEALLAGLTVLHGDVRKKASRTITKAAQQLVKLKFLIVAFKHWQCISSESKAIINGENVIDNAVGNGLDTDFISSASQQLQVVS